MSDIHELHDAIAIALRDPDPLEAVRVVCRSVVATLSVDGAAISTMFTTQHRETLCASDRSADELEELQFTLGEGPCFEAFDSGVPVLVPDLDAASASGWPVYASRAVERSEARAVFVFPLGFGSLRIGTLSTYRTLPGRLDACTVASALELAETATLVLLSVEDLAASVVRVQREAVAHGVGVRPTGHAPVHVAAGMVAEQLGLDSDAALDRLRGHAFVEGRLLTDVAGDVLARRVRFDEPPTGPE